MAVAKHARGHLRQGAAVGLSACLVAVILGAGGVPAQGGEQFAGRLSRMPVDRAIAPSISGGGEARATLAGSELTIVATFAGMSSPATAAHVHRAPIARRGPVAFTLDVAAAAGRIEQSLTLTDAQLAVLRDGRYYLQIHTEDNPGGELRGWLLPSRP
ncbi:MAG: CHRD domain-containing protein [Acidobacteria bacterium]|nr:CHRD domain-containing protein [Acidobacteriota bacterium]